MTRDFSFLAFVALLFGLLNAQEVPEHGIGTTWPGVRYQIVQVQRIPGDRLLVAVRLYTTPQASNQGVFIGEETKIPANATPEEIAAGVFRPTAFSIELAVMTEENTKQAFSTVKPDPNGPRYLPPSLLTNLHRGQAQIMTIEFPLPPPPPAGENGENPAKQTVSVLLPRALGPISGLLIPASVASSPNTQ